MSGAVRVYRSLRELDGGFGPSALSIGNFDGVHAGHRRILRRVVELARSNGWIPSALTFHPHPATVVAPERAPRLLTTPEQRCRLMGLEGIEQVLILPFGEEIAHLNPEEFARDILAARLGVRAVLVGENFHFGHSQEGDTAQLKSLGEKYNFLTEVVPAVSTRGRMISSSAIRRLIEAGNVAVAGRLLMRPHFMEGEVVPGRGIGSKKTVPTLNINSDCETNPAAGVYITRTRDLDEDRTWPSITNVGYRPTFGPGGLSVETFLLAFLTGNTPRRLRIEFLERLRAERKFEDAESLKQQILRDAQRAQAYFRRVDRWIRKAAEPALLY